MHCSNRSWQERRNCEYRYVLKPMKKRDFHKLPPAWNIAFNAVAGIFALLCVFPFLFVTIISFTDEKTLARNGYRLIPEKWSLEAYSYLFKAGDQLLSLLWGHDPGDGRRYACQLDFDRYFCLCDFAQKL